MSDYINGNHQRLFEVKIYHKDGCVTCGGLNAKTVAECKANAKKYNVKVEVSPER